MLPKSWLRVLYTILALTWTGNGVWMFFAPGHWFARIPGATDTGPLNEHLVRDYSGAFLLLGVIVLTALVRGRFTRTMHAWVTAFFALHASVHVWDVFAGRLDHAHWTTDFPGVFLPVLLLGVLCLPFAWQQEHS